MYAISVVVAQLSFEDMGKILYTKQRTSTPVVPRRLNNAISTSGRATALVNGKHDYSIPQFSSSVNGIPGDHMTEPSSVVLSTCPVCQLCFRNYVKMSQHCRAAHGLRASSSTFSKFPGKQDPKSGPPLEADTVAAHVAHNLAFWLHGKEPHLLSPEEPHPRGAATEPAEPYLDSNDAWAADKSGGIVEECHSQTGGSHTLATLYSSEAAPQDAPACTSGPPVLIKMHDETPASGSSHLNDTPPVLQMCVEHKPPTFYDEPGAWKFVCLVCHKAFQEKSIMHAHQQASHPRVACTHLQLEASCPLDVVANSVTTSKAPSTGRSQRRLACRPESLVCKACGRRLRTITQLHEHILACAAMLTPSTAATPSARARGTSDSSEPSVWRYGKSRRYRKHHSPISTG